MSELVTALFTAIASFVATNLDDLILLTMFFSQVDAKFRPWHIVFGQYLGFTVLVAASLPGFFGSYLVPRPFIELAGLVVIAIGLGRFFRQEKESLEGKPKVQPLNSFPLSSFLSPQACGVAAVTVANGGDNLSIYMPLFANSSLMNLFLILFVFFLLVGVWCFSAYQLTKQPAIAHTLRSYGNSWIPYLLVGLGVFIFWGSFPMALFCIVAVYLCAMPLVEIKFRSQK